MSGHISNFEPFKADSATIQLLLKAQIHRFVPIFPLHKNVFAFANWKDFYSENYYILTNKDKTPLSNKRHQRDLFA